MPSDAGSTIATPRLTQRQAAVLGFIREACATRRPPTQREIAEHFRLSLPGAQRHVEALERAGVITRDKWSARGIRLVETPEDEPAVDVGELRARAERAEAEAATLRDATVGLEAQVVALREENDRLRRGLDRADDVEGYPS